MSFDIFLIHFKDGQPVDADRQSFREVLHAARCTGPDKFGFYTIAFSDGTEVELSARGLESDQPFTQCMFLLRGGFGEPLLELILDLAHAGDMAIMPIMEGNPVLLVSEAQRKELPAEMQSEYQVIVVRSAAEIDAVICGGFERWSVYRDQVLRQSRQDKNE